MCSLLCLLPIAAEGQTAASYNQNWSKTPQVRQKEGEQPWRVLYEGGMMRSSRGGWFCSIPGGLNDLMVMNYVDGYSFGPHATIGYVTHNRSRWELEETVRWAGSRKTWLMKGALRWFGPVEQGVMVELHGGRHTEDFDHQPAMTTEQSLLATGLFGWNHYKLIERTDVGLRMSFALTNSLSLKSHVFWERRRQMENHKQRNVFGVRAQSNVPMLRDGYSASNLIGFDGPIDGTEALLNLQLDFQPHRTVYVYDDMTCETRSDWPKISLMVDGGVGKWRYLSLDMHIEQDVALSRRTDHLNYMVSIGGIAKHDEIGLVDWHHFDATRFWWQEKVMLSRFVMLDNYELSTDRSWIEAHTEWVSDKMLLSQYVLTEELLREYLSLHFVKVPSHRSHLEFQYGVELVKTWRFGVALGFDELTCRGAAFTMSLDIGAGRELRKKSQVQK